MNETLEYPTIDADKAPAVAQSAAVAVISIKEATLARFTATEAALRKLAERYSRVAFNVMTPKGLAEAKAARNELREQGRYAVQRVEKAIKDDVNDLKRVMAVEAERLIAIVKPVEDAVDAQIKVREEQLAAEKAERERIEAERKQNHLNNLATIRGYVAQGKGKTAEQLAKAAAAISVLELDPAAWEEFHEQAVTVRLHVHEELSRMAAEQKVREDEKAEADRQRAENERVAAEQKAEADRLAAYHAELQREREALAAERAEVERQERAAAQLRALAALNAEAEALGVRLPNGDDDDDYSITIGLATPPCFVPKPGVTGADIAAAAGVSAEEKAALLEPLQADQATPAGSELKGEWLVWNDASAALPDADTTVLCWDGETPFFTGYWDSDIQCWIDCESGDGALGVTHWSEPAGPKG